jgi:hypothetical protein
MKNQTVVKLPCALLLFVLWATFCEPGFADSSRESAEDRALLQRMYEMRIRYEQERAAGDNEARANVRLVTQSGGAGVDSPTVSGLRAATNAQLTRFEQQFRCLDVDVDSQGGNTVVICGDNSGDISGSNVSAERDIVTVPGGRP